MSGETYLISHPRVVFFLIPSLKSMRMRLGNKEGKYFFSKGGSVEVKDSAQVNKRSGKNRGEMPVKKNG
ncbi:hypothetical protein GV764_19750 [Atlantibacter hermannii]|nr:hypothetical protein [Atlantibacter hermannii]NBD01240.1 hypothetical protein [Atlantibacter hermannii]